MTPSRCNICGDRRFAACGYSPVPGWLHHSMARCLGCGLHFMLPMATAQEAESYYQSYYGDKVHPEYLDEAVQARKIQEEEAELARFLPFFPPGRLLEVGCGMGFVLATRALSKWQRSGIDLSADAVRFARDKFGLDAICCDLSQAPWEDGSFDVVYSQHTIEHVLDLSAFAAAVHRLLKPGGTVVIGTENRLALRKGLKRLGEHMRLKVPSLPTGPEHTYLMSLDDIQRLFSKFGSYSLLYQRTFEPPIVFKGGILKRALGHTTSLLCRSALPEAGLNLDIVLRKNA